MIDLATARARGTQFGREHDLDELLEPYRAHFWTGEENNQPGLVLDDVSEIPFLVDIDGVEQYQLRARLRAESGDVFAAVTPISEAYEDYCQKTLLLGNPRFLLAEPLGNPLRVAEAILEGSGLETLISFARESGQMALHPYMSIDPVWKLAKRLSQETSLPIPVLGPPPPVTWIANDKSHFHDLVQRVVGEEWLVETHRSSAPSELASALHDLSLEHQQVGLKRTRCASAMGNQVYSSNAPEMANLEGTRNIVESFLQRTQWPGDEEVLVVAWEETDLSPSTQVWIPADPTVPPRLDGIYEQILHGPEKVFLGSIPSRLSESIHTRLTWASIQVAAALQQIGYVGRCSFDFLVVGDPQDENCRLLFTECNGRWGGTSIPMRLLDRLIQGVRPPYISRDIQHPGLIGCTFENLLELLGPKLFDPKTGEGRFILYNVGPLEKDGKFDVISLGRSTEDALEGFNRILPEALGIAS
ncbi:MAG: hypothetical protein QF752_10060 [Planctomycetota bacterium]|nr:hypothetical protein [Planctomycetota bacterium]